MRLARLPATLCAAIARFTTRVDVARLARVSNVRLRVADTLAADAHTHLVRRMHTCRAALRANRAVAAAAHSRTRALAAHCARHGGLADALHAVRAHTEGSRPIHLWQRMLAVWLEIRVVGDARRAAFVPPDNDGLQVYIYGASAVSGGDTLVTWPDALVRRRLAPPALDALLQSLASPDDSIEGRRHGGSGRNVRHASPAAQDALVWALLAALGDDVCVRVAVGSLPPATVAALLVAVRGAIGTAPLALLSGDR
jgi:hypothetical protein